MWTQEHLKRASFPLNQNPCAGLLIKQRAVSLSCSAVRTFHTAASAGRLGLPIRPLINRIHLLHAPMIGSDYFAFFHKLLPKKISLQELRNAASASAGTEIGSSSPKNRGSRCRFANGSSKIKSVNDFKFSPKLQSLEVILRRKHPSDCMLRQVAALGV